MLAVALLLSGLLVTQRAVAQAEPEILVDTKKFPIRLAVQERQGHLFVQGDLYSVFFAGEIMAMSLQVSFEEPDTLIVPSMTYYKFLAMDHEKLKRGDSILVKLMLLPGMDFKIPGREVAVDPSEPRLIHHFDVTRYYSKELQERGIGAVLGRGFWKRFRVVMDLPNGEILLYPRTEEKPLIGDAIEPFEIKDERMQITVSHGGGKSGAMIFGTNDYDTYVDGAFAAALGKPAGDIGPLIVGDANGGNIDLSSYLALRPGQFPNSSTGNAKNTPFLSGINILESFRVEIDWAGSKLALSRARNPKYPQSDFEYFKAEISGKADVMQAYLEHYPEGRRALEAARALVHWRMQEANSTDEQLMAAMQWVANTAPPQHKMEFCLLLLEEISELPNRSAVIVRAGRMALSYSRIAMNIPKAYFLHNLIGEALMTQGEVEQAWQHFISAAFMPLGMPSFSKDYFHDIAVNCNLGRAYAKMGQLARAYSRYKKVEEQLKAINAYDISADSIKPDPQDDESKAGLRKMMRKLYSLQEEAKAELQRLSSLVPADFREMLDG